jgi:hypothetical protein
MAWALIVGIPIAGKLICRWKTTKELTKENRQSRDPSPNGIGLHK